MEHNVEEAINLLRKEGTIIIPLNEELLEEFKDYKITIVNKEKDFNNQQRLFDMVLDRLKDEKISYIPDQGLIRLK